MRVQLIVRQTGIAAETWVDSQHREAMESGRSCRYDPQVNPVCNAPSYVEWYRPPSAQILDVPALNVLWM